MKTDVRYIVKYFDKKTGWIKDNWIPEELKDTDDADKVLNYAAKMVRNTSFTESIVTQRY